MPDNEELLTDGSVVCPVCQSPRPDLSKPCPSCGSPAVEGAEPPSGPIVTAQRRSVPEGLFTVRASDIEPYIGLRYLSKLFRLMAIILVLLLLAEVIVGFINEGTAALWTILAEATRLIVAAGLLWGAGDFAILLIDVGHDVRAARILLGRQVAHQAQEQHRDKRREPAPHERSGDRAAGSAR